MNAHFRCNCYSLIPYENIRISNIYFKYTFVDVFIQNGPAMPVTVNKKLPLFAINSSTYVLVLLLKGKHKSAIKM